MNFRGKLKSTVAVMFAAGMLVATGAHADQLKMELKNDSGFDVKVEGVQIYSTASYFEVENIGKGSFQAFCYELTSGVSLEAITTGMDFSEHSNNNEYTAALFNQFYGSLDMSNATDVAAFQIALWETQDDNNLSTGSYKDWVLGPNVGSTAQKFLDGVNDNTVIPKYSYNLTVWKNDGTQDVIQATPVPEPETYAMFAVGLALLGLRRRKA